jgi:hypothetical protein
MTCGGARLLIETQSSRHDIGRDGGQVATGRERVGAEAHQGLADAHP